MKWVSTNWFYFECSGPDLYAIDGFIGIEPETEAVSGGWDSGIGAKTDFSDAERAELADYMIALWTRFKETE